MSDTVTSPEVVLAHLDTLPTLPPVAVRVLEMTADGTSDAADVVRLLANDQSLTAKILSVANCAALGVRTAVTTLGKAVPLLGFSAVRTIVLAATVFDAFGKRPTDRQPFVFDRLEFWKHALAVACGARRLALARPDLNVDPEDAFVAGLLHDLGKVALDAVFPKAYTRIAAEANDNRDDIADHERSILGADHTVAGRRLAERWRLPRALQETIWLHHLSPDALPASVSAPQLIGLVQLADTLAREQRLGYSGNHLFYEHSPRLADRLGFRPEQVRETVELLGNDVAEQSEMLGLDGETAEGMYVKAMTRANAELARLNEELTSGNRQLASGARYFNAITDFEQRLTDWADPAAVLIALAGAAAAALQRKRTAAFALRQNLSAVDICWTGEREDDRGHATQAVPLDLLGWMHDAQQNPAQTLEIAPPAVHGLFTGWLTSGGSGAAWLLPIVHGSDVAGGIVFQSEADERARLAGELKELRSFLASVGLALGRANAQTAARRLSEDLAETNRRLQHVQVELLRSRTLSMIAEMAAGAGHELNGPLTVISGRAQMLASATADREMQRTLQTIIEKAHECSGIVSELMDFARPRAPQLVPVDVRELLEEMRAEWIQESGLAAGQIRVEDWTPEAAGSAGTLWLRADRAQVQVVLRELLSNAAAAVRPVGGTIHLRYRPQATAAATAIELHVADTGVGMSPAVLQRAFDPFFSHRDAGRSRGLGLARAYRIVEAHGGRIWLESRPDEGTTAHVVLPRQVGGGAPG